MFRHITLDWFGQELINNRNFSCPTYGAKASFKNCVYKSVVSFHDFDEVTTTGEAVERIFWGFRLFRTKRPVAKIIVVDKLTHRRGARTSEQEEREPQAGRAG